ncbi:hypothetical protein RB195_025159 [Necator americanus]|uniref:Peptidase A2 domain-containing protein n=1 Tax=Necator americanus TaxID=51031 RepID=A0ABR1ER55_NECAM
MSDVSNSFSAWKTLPEDKPALCIAFRRSVSPPRHYEAKFNYLVNALRGEARELIRRYPITDSNYDHAVDLSHSKYGNESALIGNLRSLSETAKAESGSIKAQRRLLETIVPIVTQLQELRVNLDGSYLSQKILAKFSTALQRQALQGYVKGPTAIEAKGRMTQKPPRDGAVPTLPQPQKLHAVTPKKNRQKPEKKITRVYPVHLHTTDSTDIISETCPTTTDEPHKLWKEVEILFDTGADQSFISQRLEDDLGLECTKQQEFLMYTFGTDEPTPARCGTTQLELWDNDGRRHTVRLCTTPQLTGKGRPVHLSTEDRKFARQHHIQLSKPTDTPRSTPQILLECDQLRNLLDTPLPRFTLPSGLQLIPSKLEYMLFGKQQLPKRIKTQQAVRNIITLTMNTVANDFEEELKRWDKPLTYQSAMQEDLTSIRPVDFFQRDINITFPLERLVEPTDVDEDYLPPDELRTL